MVPEEHLSNYIRLRFGISASPEFLEELVPELEVNLKPGAEELTHVEAEFMVLFLSLDQRN